MPVAHPLPVSAKYLDSVAVSNCKSGTTEYVDSVHACSGDIPADRQTHTTGSDPE